MVEDESKNDEAGELAWFFYPMINQTDGMDGDNVPLSLSIFHGHEQFHENIIRKEPHDFKRFILSFSFLILLPVIRCNKICNDDHDMYHV